MIPQNPEPLHSTIMSHHAAIRHEVAQVRLARLARQIRDTPPGCMPLCTASRWHRLRQALLQHLHRGVEAPAAPETS